MASMTVEVVSPERVLFSGEATMVITRTLGGGEIAFLPGHAPFLGALTENHTRVFLVDGVDRRHRRARRLRRGQQQQGVDPVRRRRARPRHRRRARPGRHGAVPRSGCATSTTPKRTAALNRATARLRAAGSHRLTDGRDRHRCRSPVSVPVGAGDRSLVGDRRGDGRHARRRRRPDRRRRPARRSAGSRSPSVTRASRCSSPTWRPTPGKRPSSTASPTSSDRSTWSSTTPGSARAATSTSSTPIGWPRRSRSTSPR